MNFLNVGPWELMVILVIAILLVGPRRVVEIARTIGRVTAHMRRLSGEFMGTIQAELRATEQEARQALESVVEEGQQSVASIPAEFRATEREARQALGNIGEDEAEATLDVRAELGATERETYQALEEIVEGIGDLVKGKQGVEVKKGQDEEAGKERSG